MRVGIGYDSHRFDDTRPLILGGVEIPGSPGLLGHSDGDAIAHALIDALLGAAGADDIGSHFPPSEERWKGADSMELLRHTMETLDGRGFRVVNVDIVVICEAPSIRPHSLDIRERLSEQLQIGISNISVKGKSNEGLGWIGRSEGIAVHAVALVEPLYGASPR